MSFTIIKECRLCKYKELHPIIFFGDVPLANSYPATQEEKEETFPLTMVRCEACGHVQLRETVDPQKLFSNYLYSSSTSPALVEHFQQYAKDVIKFIPHTEYIKIIDIGCNDGILLKEFSRLGLFDLVGVDPAQNLVSTINDKSIKIVPKFFNKVVAQEIFIEHGPFHVICCNNTFAHIDQLDSVAEGIKALLTHDGVFIFESAYLLDTIKNLYFDQCYFEHLQYYGLKPILQYLWKYDLEIFKVERVNIQGGSIRVYVKHKSCSLYPTDESVQRFVLEEEKFGLYDIKTYADFHIKLENLQDRLDVLLSILRDERRSISCYGCPAKFTLFSKFFKLSAYDIPYVVDDSPLKQGRFSPGLKIPIVSRQYFLDHPTDYCIISVWNMAESIIERNKDYKGRFILPMPDPKIIT